MSDSYRRLRNELLTKLRARRIRAGHYEIHVAAVEPSLQTGETP